MASQIPAHRGAYLLLIELTKATDVRLSNKRRASLVPGHYLYAGSAYGPGGLKARIARHMRRAKVQRWHVDQLTKTGVFQLLDLEVQTVSVVGVICLVLSVLPAN